MWLFLGTQCGWYKTPKPILSHFWAIFVSLLPEIVHFWLHTVAILVSLSLNSVESEFGSSLEFSVGSQNTSINDVSSHSTSYKLTRGKPKFKV